MNNAELRKGLKDLRNSIEDLIDNLEMDGEGTPPKKEKKSPDDVKDVSGKFSSKVEEDEDGKKKEH